MQIRKDEREAFENFSRDTANHSMEVLHDSGLYRHLRFSRNGSSVYHFDLVSYPGYLCYSGDMGCFVFYCAPDMFDFFSPGDYEEKKQVERGMPYINPGYWSQKLCAVDGNRMHASATEFDAEKFKRAINEFRVGWMKAETRDPLARLLAEDGPIPRRLSAEDRRKLWEAVEDEILGELDNGQERAEIAAYDFAWQSKAGEWYRFTDLQEYSFSRFTHTYLWACFAISWGVQRYDTYKAQQAALYYLQDSRSSSYVGNCPSFWKKGGGYTTNIDEAERMTFEKAMAQHAARDTDLPWLCSEVNAMRRATIDFQYFPRRFEDQRQLLQTLANGQEVAA